MISIIRFRVGVQFVSPCHVNLDKWGVGKGQRELVLPRHGQPWQYTGCHSRQSNPISNKAVHTGPNWDQAVRQYGRAREILLPPYFCRPVAKWHLQFFPIRMEMS